MLLFLQIWEYVGGPQILRPKVSVVSSKTALPTPVTMASLCRLSRLLFVCSGLRDRAVLAPERRQCLCCGRSPSHSQCIKIFCILLVYRLPVGKGFHGRWEAGKKQR